MKHKIAAPMMLAFFDQIVGVLLRGIFSFYAMNERTIQQLENFSSRSAHFVSEATA